MNIKSIKNQLRAYSIMGKRETTINHAFASAIAPNDIYEEKIVRKAIKILKQDPNNLSCVYCGAPAETWDHVFGLVKNHNFSGYGHVIGNLVPCCKKCNSEKGNRNWEVFIKTKPNYVNRSKMLLKYFKKYPPVITNYNYKKNVFSREIGKLETIKRKVFKLMKEADSIAIKIRQKIKK